MAHPLLQGEVDQFRTPEELRAELARMVGRRRENREAPAASPVAADEASAAAS